MTSVEWNSVTKRRIFDHFYVYYVTCIVFIFFESNCIVIVSLNMSSRNHTCLRLKSAWYLYDVIWSWCYSINRCIINVFVSVWACSVAWSRVSSSNCGLTQTNSTHTETLSPLFTSHHAAPHGEAALNRDERRLFTRCLLSGLWRNNDNLSVFV